MTEPVTSPESPVDPDAAAITREFIDFTEYLPADMFRSMQLIRQLNRKADDYGRKVDALTREFAGLPERARASTRDDTGSSAEFVAPTVSDRELELRLRISRAINESLVARKEAAAEAERVKENIARHHARITAIRDKLNQITIPPRDPTPTPSPPQKQRTADVEVKKIRLRAPSDKPGPIGRPRRGNSFTAAHTPRSRRIHHADDKDDDGWEDIPQSPRHYDRLKKKKKGPGIPKRGPKPSGDPPFLGGASSRYENGTLIPNHLLPWNRLTNEELAKLRKRMKKNSGWTPSVTMIIRELESLGRGPKHKEKYEDQWGGSRGEEFLRIYGPEDGGTGDPEMIAPDDGAGVRENKGMRLNRAKKRKREEERKEKEREAERERVLADREQDKLRKQEEELRERREREEKELEEAEREKAAAIALAKEKQEKEEAAREKAATREREKAAADAASKSTRSASPSTTRAAVTADEDEAMPDAEAELPPRPAPKPRLGRPPKNPPAVSPPSGEKRKRALSTTAIPVLSLAESRTKRGESAVAPPPATVSLAVGRKRANSTAGPKPTQKATKPGKKKGLMAGNSRKRGEDTLGTDGAGEWVDDDEDEDLNKYCLCDEVSRDTMVLCDNEQCLKQWFHIECVGLSEEEAKNEELKWFCPNCEGKRGGKRRRKA